MNRHTRIYTSPILLLASALRQKGSTRLVSHVPHTPTNTTLFQSCKSKWFAVIQSQFVLPLWPWTLKRHKKCQFHRKPASAQSRRVYKDKIISSIWQFLSLVLGCLCIVHLKACNQDVNGMPASFIWPVLPNLVCIVRKACRASFFSDCTAPIVTVSITTSVCF